MVRIQPGASHCLGRWYPDVISGRALLDALKRRGYGTLSGVPCSYLAGLIEAAAADPEVRYVPAANEGAAVAIAAGAALAGIRGAALLQNSGLGNAVNPLTSLNAPYALPVLLIVSLRGYPVPEDDEPQHSLMGRQTATILNACAVDCSLIPEHAEGLGAGLDRVDASLARGRCHALLVPRDTIAPQAPAPSPEDQPALSRSDAIAIASAAAGGTWATVATTGLVSRELMAAGDRALNFYMAGSMGHALAIGLGCALSQPERPVAVFDGDGAALMHLGTLSTVGAMAPANLLHIVLDNEAYASTGNQPSTSASTDLAQVAAACGYRRSWTCRTGTELEQAVREAAESPAAGPSIIVAKVGGGGRTTVPRVTREHTLPEVRVRFTRAVTG